MTRGRRNRVRGLEPGKTRTVAHDCSVIPFAAVPGVCDLCGTALRGSQRRWCSKRCQVEYRANHNWTTARAAARKRDRYTCQHCGVKRATYDDPNAQLEVNHIVPLNGQGYGWSCAHHLAGLETLCRPCHRAVTKAQRLARATTE